MRTIPRHLVVWGILLAFLCVLPTAANVAVAKPFPHEGTPGDPNGNDPDPKGEDDGGLVKSPGNPAGTIGTTSRTWTSDLSLWSAIRGTLIYLRMGSVLRITW